MVGFLSERVQALDETGSTGTCELISLKESFQTYINSKGGESKLRGEKAKRPRPYNVVENAYAVGGLKAEALTVSHSLEGVTAYILHTSAGPVVYTGDFRFHGYKGDEEVCVKGTLIRLRQALVKVSPRRQTNEGATVLQ